MTMRTSAWWTMQGLRARPSSAFATTLRAPTPTARELGSVATISALGARIRSPLPDSQPGQPAVLRHAPVRNPYLSGGPPKAAH